MFLLVRLAERAQERYEAKRAEYEQKLERRREREEATGKKPRGRPPQEPEAGPKDKDQVNFTDEQSRIMPGGGGEFVQGYNAQAAVEHDSHLVVGNHVSQATNDKREVEPALNELAKVAEQLGTPQVMVADAGYHSKENVERCERQGIEPYIAGSREHHNQPLAQRMQAPPACAADADAVTAMQYRLRIAEGKAIYSKRKATVETVFGVIKAYLGVRGNPAGKTPRERIGDLFGSRTDLIDVLLAGLEAAIAREDLPSCDDAVRLLDRNRIDGLVLPFVAALHLLERELHTCLNNARNFGKILDLAQRVKKELPEGTDDRLSRHHHR